MTTHNRYYPKDTDLRFTMLTREQERELFALAKSGDGEAREFLIKNHLLFAARQARQMVKGKLPDEDVVSAANFAVMRAFDKFDHTRGNRFTSYLRLFIKGEIASLWKNLSAMRKSVPGSAHPHNGSPRGMNDSGEKWSSNSPKTLGYRSPIPVETPHADAEESEHLSYLQLLIDESKISLNPHERDIIRRVYEENKSFADIGRENGVSREAVRATHGRALEKLKAALRDKGVENAR